MARVRFLVTFFGALALVVVTAAPSAAAPPDATAAVSYLESQQVTGADPALGAGSWDADTGFGLAEFNTTEVVLALAEAAQTGSTWNATEARVAIEGVTNPDGRDPLDFLDHWAGTALDPATAGKFLLLVALPLDDGAAGFAPSAWDPAGDGTPVDLVAALDGGCADDPANYGFYVETFVAMQAKAQLCGTAGPASVAFTRAAQQANGGWSFDGDPTGATEADVDVTSQAIMALVAGGVPGNDPAVVGGLTFIAERQQPEGWWNAFGSASPDTTSRAMLAIVAAGFDPASSAWRDAVLPSAAGTPYTSHDDALGALQQADGSVVGPATFSASYATAQAIQGVERSWLPVVQATPFEPPTEPPPIEPPPAEPPPTEQPPIVDPGLETHGGGPADGGAGDQVGAAREVPSTLPRTGAPLATLAFAGLALTATGAATRILFRMMR